MLAHRLLGGSSSSLSVSRLSLGSALIATARARLWSSFKCVLYPLSSRTRKQRGKKKSLACSAAPDLFPDSLLASTAAQASAPSPRLPRRLSRQASRAAECCSAPILRAGISPLCTLHSRCCALLRGSEASPTTSPSPPHPRLHQ